MKITRAQQQAASIYWLQVLTGKITPKSLLASRAKTPPFAAELGIMSRNAHYEKLNIENPNWPITFMLALDDLLSDADLNFVISLDYHPTGVLKQAAKKANIPVRLFPLGKIYMSFDDKGHIIVDGEEIDAARFVIDVFNEMKLEHIEYTNQRKAKL